MYNYVDDVSGTGNDGIITNQTATSTASGAIGQGIDLDGVNDYVYASDDNTLDITGAITIAAWIKADSLTTGTEENRLALKGGGTHTANIYTFEVDDGNVRFYLDSDSGPPDTGQCDGSSSQRCVRGATTINTGEWYHVVGWYDGSSEVRVYVNGVQDGSVATSDAGVPNSSPFLVGGRDNSSDMFDGVIDDLRVYNRALSQAEITRLYNMGK
jgi:hypothetical protein